ncbi:unnamed protein product [Malus baccata var. baccata]
MIELDEIKDELVGTPGGSGISTEQRKRLTIAVGLVSNPSIIFMDEPTSGLDARAAAIVMRVVKNIEQCSFLLQCMGVGNCSSVLPFVATERSIVYRERFAGMYSSWAYSFSQVIVEIPYITLQAALFSTITYLAINFHWSLYKAFWYFYTMFCTLLCFNFFGMLLVSLTPTFQVASVVASFCYTMINMFSGFLIPGPKIPVWWIWGSWICPLAWSLKGFLTSQYGDLEKEIVVRGEQKSIGAFLESIYGYNYNDLGVVAAVLFAFPLVFALAFAGATEKLYFQRRNGIPAAWPHQD